MGNLIGHYQPSPDATQKTEKTRTLLLGSHLDTVRDAGKYDGPLGVMVALACIERLHARGQRLPFALELYAFTDEEGLRYHTAYLGSSAVVGAFDPALLSLTDGDGITLEQALRDFGGDPDQLQAARRAPDNLLGYCEVHIEQGPVLESLDLPVGVVSAIAGQSRFDVTFTGTAGHAGTVPMQLRHDALCAAAEFILAVEHYAQAVPGLVATVGQVRVQPGASNVIPGAVVLSLDVRHQEDTLREQACADLYAQAQQLATHRSMTLTWCELQGNATVRCASELVSHLQQAVTTCGYPLHTLPSGAGHDGVMLSRLTGIAMLFVRCRGGISHNPAESVLPADVAVAIDVLEQFLLSVALPPIVGTSFSTSV
jgi:allantoate deiminase